jgi:hypothetical protein
VAEGPSFKTLIENARGFEGTVDFEMLKGSVKELARVKRMKEEKGEISNRCYKCGQSGHIRINCWMKKKVSEDLEQEEQKRKVYQDKGKEKMKEKEKEKEKEKGKEPADIKSVVCYRCQKKGHYASNCHEKIESVNFIREVNEESPNEEEIEMQEYLELMRGED